MRLYFSFSNMQLQDNGYDLAVNDIFRGVFNIYPKYDSVVYVPKTNTSLKHIKDNKYEITCYVYENFNNILFVEAQGLYFMIDKRTDCKIKKRKYYNFTGYISNNEYNDLIIRMFKFYDKFYKQFEVEGTIKSIAFDTKELEPSKIYNSAIQRFDYKIEKTTKYGWGEGKKFPNTSGDYLAELEIKDIDIQRKSFIQVLTSLLIKKLK